MAERPPPGATSRGEKTPKTPVSHGGFRVCRGRDSVCHFQTLEEGHLNKTRAHIHAHATVVFSDSCKTLVSRTCWAATLAA